MTLVETYVFRASRTAFLAALVVLTAVIWMTQALRDFDLLTTKGQSILTFLSVTALGLPSLVLIIAPVALFIAVLYALNKLNSDSELIVMSAAGLSPGRLMRPFALLTILTTLLAAAMSLYLMPWSFRELRDQIMKIRADFLSHVVREGTFTTLDQGFIFHYRERGPDGALRGILMEDRRDPARITTYIAEEGQAITVGDDSFLVLKRGNVQRHDANARDAALVEFQSYALDLAQFGAEGTGGPLKPRERTTTELLRLNPRDPGVAGQMGRYRAELHDRFAGPLYALCFGLIAFAALSEARTTRQGRGTAMLGAIVCVLLLRTAGFGASALVVKSAGWIWLVYGLPVFGLGSAAVFMIRPRLSWPRPAPIAMTAPSPA